MHISARARNKFLDQSASSSISEISAHANLASSEFPWLFLLPAQLLSVSWGKCLQLWVDCFPFYYDCDATACSRFRPLQRQIPMRARRGQPAAKQFQRHDAPGAALCVRRQPIERRQAHDDASRSRMNMHARCQNIPSVSCGHSGLFPGTFTPGSIDVDPDETASPVSWERIGMPRRGELA